RRRSVGREDLQLLAQAARAVERRREVVEDEELGPLVEDDHAHREGGEQHVFLLHARALSAGRPPGPAGGLSSFGDWAALCPWPADGANRRPCRSGSFYSCSSPVEVQPTRPEAPAEDPQAAQAPAAVATRAAAALWGVAARWAAAARQAAA